MWTDISIIAAADVVMEIIVVGVIFVVAVLAQNLEITLKTQSCCFVVATYCLLLLTFFFLLVFALCTFMNISKNILLLLLLFLLS